MTNTISMLTAMFAIDEAAETKRLYHYNGAQAYIRSNNNSNELMIIDHGSGNATVEFRDGTSYFNTYSGQNIACSKQLLKSGSMVLWYKENFLTKENA